jgi:hypothetical protein
VNAIEVISKLENTRGVEDLREWVGLLWAAKQSRGGNRKGGRKIR